MTPRRTAQRRRRNSRVIATVAIMNAPVSGMYRLPIAALAGVVTGTGAACTPALLRVGVVAGDAVAEGGAAVGDGVARRTCGRGAGGGAGGQLVGAQEQV
ncbi:hypothetical protein ACFO1B_35375, partial [Dactylosporangium siamense]|uniref:hypothetical protein n=1 Tax=Dactylosporangium siamense TaxID=685454 RepID=UPI00361BCF50